MLTNWTTRRVNTRSTTGPQSAPARSSGNRLNLRFTQHSRAARRAWHPLLIPRSQVRFLPGPTSLPANAEFVGCEVRGNDPRVDIRLLTRARTPEESRTSASRSERSQHILNPKVTCAERPKELASARTRCVRLRHSMQRTARKRRRADARMPKRCLPRPEPWKPAWRAACPTSAAA
jgi:hypothetical protein